jgi:hypothetical protein
MMELSFNVGGLRDRCCRIEEINNVVQIRPNSQPHKSFGSLAGKSYAEGGPLLAASYGGFL